MALALSSARVSWVSTGIRFYRAFAMIFMALLKVVAGLSYKTASRKGRKSTMKIVNSTINRK